MKKAEITIGGQYIAKVSGRLTTVRVNNIVESSHLLHCRQVTLYFVTNLRTGRKTTFRSAAKFRCRATIGNPKMVGVPDAVPGCTDTGFNNRHED